MRPSSAKQKGRRFQQQIRDDLRELGKKHGLEDDDYVSTGMGQPGVDVILTPAAKRLVNLSIECKNVEALNVVTVFKGHYEKYKNDPALKLLVHTKNHTAPMVTLRWEDFLRILEERLNVKHN